MCYLRYVARFFGEHPLGNLSTIDAVYIALAFLVPGFVMSAARNQFITGQEPQGGEQLIRFLTYSAINYALFSAPIYLFLNAQLPPASRAILWSLVILIGPALLGSISGVAARKGWIRKLFHWIDLNPVHAIPTAWDYKFGGLKGGEWVLITLKSGTRFAGFCGTRSFASSESKERDLFIEAVFNLDDDNQWTPTKKSVFIASGEIATIEFWPEEMENNHDQQQDAAIADESASVATRVSAATGVDSSTTKSSSGTSADNGSGCALKPAESGFQREEVSS